VVRASELTPLAAHIAGTHRLHDYLGTDVDTHGSETTAW
jgi:hypothetical protein